MSSAKSHLDSVDETYFQHMKHAFSFSVELFTASACCLVHAFLPSLFEKKGSSIVGKLHDRMVINRANLTPSSTRVVEEHEVNKLSKIS
ncbi:MAG: hypothetical protein COA96_07800 [SAR86 cluster bacterium]|uniref:Capsule biosynthesis protein n=1 Tax=SAR86 cluster bacterium TaxID=2030880 RepID=A0A2A5B0W6_9GAMM|nr:MAG: hypothetical protein COA96_07800 [SAR86 cluster bacterium]